MKLTKQQQAVVDAPRGNILVSAAAGSGKTSVMTERIARRIMSKDLSVDRMLVMTFTNAAAANMSAKMEKRLRAELNSALSNEQRQYINEQISLLPAAHISTIHAFCNEVIGNFSFEARDQQGELLILPGSAILDQVRTNELLSESFDEVFRKIYDLYLEARKEQPETPSDDLTAPVKGQSNRIISEQSFGGQAVPHFGTSGFPFTLDDEKLLFFDWTESMTQMITAFGGKRDNDSLKEEMGKQLAYLRSLPDYEKWVQKALQKKKFAAFHFSESDTAKQILAHIDALFERCMPVVRELQKAVDDVIFVKKGNEERRASFHAWFDAVETAYQKRQSKAFQTYADFYEYAQTYSSMDFPTYRKNQDSALLDFDAKIAPFWEIAYALFGKTANKTRLKNESEGTPRFFFGKSEAQTEEELQHMVPYYSRYFEVILAVDALYKEKKRAIHSIDFADQEQIALALLRKEEVAGYYRELFDEIYIDEYQDNSGVQDAIVGRISKDNVFFVGDVKQSIYRFRHAKPEMFMKRRASYAKHENGTLFELNSNFRSVPGVIAFVNDLFFQLMSESYAGIEYDESHMLIANRDAQNDGEATCELLLVEHADISDATPENGRADDSADENATEIEDSSSAPEEEDSTRIDCEALAIAKKLQSLAQREDFSWSQCVVMTATNASASSVAKKLQDCGIPAQGPSIEDIFSNRDIHLWLNLMRVTDNPMQDIPFASVLKAPFQQTGYTDADLMEIYLKSHIKQDTNAGTKTLLYHRVTAYIDEHQDLLAFRLNQTMEWLRQLKKMSMQMTLSEWLMHTYVQTRYLDTISSQASYESRKNALIAFREWAGSFDRSRRTGLYTFVQYVEALVKQKAKTTDIELSDPVENVVSCMTIHKSKGLEFEYVFLCGMDRKTTHAGSSKVLLSENGDIASSYYDNDAALYFDTHDYFLLKRREFLAEQAELLRVLYVAFTRAMNRLFIVCDLKRGKQDELDGFSSIGKIFTLREEHIPDTLMEKLNNHWKMTVAGLIRNPKTPVFRLFPSLSEANQAVFSSVATKRTSDVAYQFISHSSVLEIPKENMQDASKLDCDVNHFMQVTDVDTVLASSQWCSFTEQLLASDKVKPEMNVPSKTTVSEMKRLLSDSGDEEGRAASINLHVRDYSTVASGQMDAATKGTLLHSVWQYLDYSSLYTRRDSIDWHAEIQRLSEYKMILPDHMDIVLKYEKQLDAFTRSELCARIVASESRKECGPYKEIPFALAHPTEDGSFTLVQGMIDCWFVDDDGQAVLIDYKSDRLSGTYEERVDTLRNKYAVQLDTYAKAITAATGKIVKEKTIWSIEDACAYSL